MEESLDNAKDELKRVDHLFYVSLKYTRTADMMRHMIERLINAFSFGVESLLKHAKENKKVDNIPENPITCCKTLLGIFQDEELIRDLNIYLTLRKTIRADYSKREEYRRHVTMTCIIDDNNLIEINIDSLKEYYDAARDFIDFVERIVRGKEEL